MKSVAVTPIAISVTHLGLLLGLSNPAAYALAEELGAFTVPGARKGKRVLLQKVRERMGDAVAEGIARTLTHSMPVHACPVALQAIPASVAGENEDEP